MRPLPPGAWILGGWLLAVGARWAHPPVPTGSVLSPVVARGLALGVGPRAATLTWWATSTQWVRDDRVAAEPLQAALRAVHHDDPRWVTPWIYGGLMLQTQGDGAAAVPVLEEAAAHFPDARWFPAALGVAHHDADELEAARAWLDRARRP